VLNQKPTVIDFFCGAGGFSEGFRQQGFSIIKGYDKWSPAVETYNHNFGQEKAELKDLLEFENSELIQFIENQIPDTDVIIGSPPCVSFSTSNKSGKADKSLGIRLTEVFLKIIVIKRFKKNSILKAWFMENVTKSIDHLPSFYRFCDLGLTDWAKKRRIGPNKKAISIKRNSIVVNSADYGSPQTRLRAITGEIIKLGAMVTPYGQRPATEHLTLKQVISKLPPPNSKLSERLVSDPLYPNLAIPMSKLTDHFYDTGLYESTWLDSKFFKTNHPYMGYMSFPENEDKPSRTVTATKIGGSREALIYKSEYDRRGNGEFRTPTVREAATIMGFPITYQFIGPENTKWRLVGNAVCPSVSRAIATSVRSVLGLPICKSPNLIKEVKLTNVPNLNSFEEKPFDSTPKRMAGSRFRRHALKAGNMTVTLSNYDIKKNTKKVGKWITSVQYGNGDGFPHSDYADNYYKKIENVVREIENGGKFLEIVKNGFSEKIANGKLLQQMHECNKSVGAFLEPSKLVEAAASIIESFTFNDPNFECSKVFKGKTEAPKKQILALYVLNKISSLANASN
jgi:DNA (cytosine-5)-methyltransferase 1